MFVCSSVSTSSVGWHSVRFDAGGFAQFVGLSQGAVCLLRPRRPLTLVFRPSATENAGAACHHRPRCCCISKTLSGMRTIYESEVETPRAFTCRSPICLEVASIRLTCTWAGLLKHTWLPKDSQKSSVNHGDGEQGYPMGRRGRPLAIAGESGTVRRSRGSRKPWHRAGE
jgi:hypothetical protein